MSAPLGPFRVGEQPTAPLLLTLSMPDGATPDLADYQSVEVESDGLPAGETSIVDPAAGTVAYAFTAPFTTPGRYEVRARMVGKQSEGGGVDVTGSLDFDVVDDQAAWLTPADAYRITGRPVAARHLAAAAARVSAVIGAAVQLASVRSAYTRQDQAKIGAAVAWQASVDADGEASTTGLPFPDLPPGVVSASLDGMSVTKAGGEVVESGAAVVPLSPIAARYLLDLSVRRRTIPTVGYEDRGDRPSTWKPLR